MNNGTATRGDFNSRRDILGSRAGVNFKYFNSYLGVEENALDVLVLDEAHRIRETSHGRFTPKAKRTDELQIDELVRAAKVSVFFIDDKQGVRPGEIGSTEMIRAAAERADAEVSEHTLEMQFRCGGSDRYISWVENTLGLERTADVIWDGTEEFDFDVVDTPRELQAIINSHDQQGYSARLVAGFCWPWSDPTPEGDLRPGRG